MALDRRRRRLRCRRLRSGGQNLNRRQPETDRLLYKLTRTHRTTRWWWEWVFLHKKEAKKEVTMLMPAQSRDTARNSSARSTYYLFFPPQIANYEIFSNFKVK
jgi:hypothetical protein